MSGKDKAEEYRRRLEAYEAEAAEAAKLFNPKELARKTNTMHSIEHPLLGTIRYGLLVYGDLAEIQRCIEKYGESKEEVSTTMLWLMLRKAYPDLTREEVKQLPFDVATTLLSLLLKEAGFLTVQQTGTASANGLNATWKPKKQA